MLVKIQNVLNNMFNTLHLLDGVTHWVTQRFSVLLVISCMVFSFFFDSLYFFVLAIILLTFHIGVGLRTLIDDYIHDEQLFLVSVTFLRITVLFALKVIFILFVC